MKTTWLLNTNSDPLGAARQFLHNLWVYAGLEGMLLPVYQAEGAGVSPSLVTNPGDLARADPFAPLVTINAARLVSHLVDTHPGARMAVVMRPCEVRALRWLVDQGGLSMGEWLVIGVDCLASYPAADFEWRVHKSGAVESLTRETLRFARHGGIAPYRYRHACQMCAYTAAQDADLNIELLGLPVKQHVLVTARNEQIASQLHLHKFTDGVAPPALVTQRRSMLSGLVARRQRALERTTQAISPEAPADVGGLLRHIANCAPCLECLGACPIYTSDFMSSYNSSAEPFREAKRWLQACVSCGMCEEACPKHLPLTAIISRINRRIQEMPAPDVYPVGIAS